MIGIQNLHSLARILDTTTQEMSEIAKNANAYYRQYDLLDPAHPHKKNRVVLEAVGPLRDLQERIHRRVLKRNLTPSAYSYGGIQGQSIKKNAMQHSKSRFASVIDLSNFYPNIHDSKICDLYLRGFCCSHAVSSMLTRLCTYKHCLSLGLVTSPFLADQVMKSVDWQIAEACRPLNVVYTRYVDDLAFSAHYNIDDCPLIDVVRKILIKNGLSVNASKEMSGCIENVPITKLVVKRNRIDVEKKYIDKLVARLEAAIKLSNGHPIEGDYFYRKNQLAGMVNFVLWINPGRRRHLCGLLGHVNSKMLDRYAKQFGYMVLRKKLVLKLSNA